jgi:large subunit ribosomal protein L10
LEATLRRASSAVLVDYRGLKHRELEDLRAAMRAKGVQVQIVKNTLLRLALMNLNANVDALSENLTGPTAIAFGFEQPAAPVEVLTEFARTHEKCQIKPLGLIGTYPAPLDAIKTLRGRDELLGEFVALLSAPMGLVYQTLTNLGRTPLTTLMSLGQSPLGLLQGLSALKEQEQSA